MKITHRFFGFLYSFALILILLVTAFDVACYADYGFFQREYEKYGVLEDLSMEMDDVMEVTAHMMDYLRGREESMQIRTTVGGVERDFFNEQDLFHMGEVKGLFLGMFRIRTWAAVVLAVSLAVLWATGAGGRTMFRCFQGSLVFFFALIAALGLAIAVNFSRAFVLFHHLFFDNDLWLFDPATDLMINMLPEGLFMDFAIRILGFFALFLVLCEGAFFLGRRFFAKGRRGSGRAAALVLAVFLASLGPAAPALASPEGAGASAVPAALGAAAAPAAGIPGSALSYGLFFDDLTTQPGWPQGPEVQADAAILIDARTGNILYAKDIYTAYPPASITKILTALVACEQSNLTDTIVYSANAINSMPFDASKVGFSVDEAVSMRDSLYGLMLKSGNEAAVGIAEHISGSEAAFCERMNERAAEAGATNSNFLNSNGLPNDGHYTTCYDMAMIMRDAVHNDTFLEIASTASYEILPTNIEPDGYTFSNSHRMMNQNRDEYYEYAVAGKTGYTSKAGNTLVTYAKNGDMELICVILHSLQTQYSDSRALFEYGFQNFTCYNTALEDTTYNNNGMGFFSFLSSTFDDSPLSVQLDDCYILLPSSVPFSALSSHLEYAEEEDAGSNILGYVHYEYEGVEVGVTALRLITRSGEPADGQENAGSPTPAPGSSGDGAGTAFPGDAAGGSEAAPGGSSGANETASGAGGTVFPGNPAGSQAAPLETAPGSTGDSAKKVITINLWDLCGYLFLAALAALVCALLIRHYSPKQRRIRKAREMRRIYMSGERKKKKKRKELR